jgi:competence protein ComFC
MVRFLREFIHRLAYIPQSECVICYKQLRMRSMLCASCVTRIPWITEVHCRTCGKPTLCSDCPRMERMIKRSGSAVRYDASMRDWLIRYKYKGDARLEALFVRMMYRACAHIAHRIPTVVTYVPMSQERHDEKGFDPICGLAQGVARYMRAPLLRLVDRHRHTPQQSMLSRTARLTSVAGAFVVHEQGWDAFCRWAKRQRAPSVRVVFVDDVYTTGSTLHHCAIPVRDASAKAIQFEAVTWAR